MPVIGLQVQRLVLIAIVHSVLKSSLVRPLLCTRLRVCGLRHDHHGSCTQYKYKYDFRYCSQHKFSSAPGYRRVPKGTSDVIQYWIPNLVPVLPQEWLKARPKCSISRVRLDHAETAGASEYRALCDRHKISQSLGNQPSQLLRPVVQTTYSRPWCSLVIM